MGHSTGEHLRPFPHELQIYFARQSHDRRVVGNTSPPGFDLLIDCGCFSWMEKQTVGWGGIVRNVSLIAVALATAILCGRTTSRPRSINNRTPPGSG